MGIFSRMRDIISSNINSMLEQAENPEKLIKLMLQEMEDTLIEVKSQCAGVMAQRKNLGRQDEQLRERAEEWNKKARLAMEKAREDLAREALVEKRRYQERADSLTAQLAECDALVEQYQNDISQLESKIDTVREKQKSLVQRHAHASVKKRAQQHIRKADTSDVMARFEGFERRVDHMEAEADLVNYGRKPSLEKEFVDLEGDTDLEKELDALRRQVRGGGEPTEG